MVTILLTEINSLVSYLWINYILLKQIIYDTPPNFETHFKFQNYSPI